MAFNLTKAIESGATDDQIAEYLASTRKFDIQGALKEGYSHKEIIEHLSQRPSKPPIPAQPAQSPVTEALKPENPPLPAPVSPFPGILPVPPVEGAQKAVRLAQESPTFPADVMLRTRPSAATQPVVKSSLESPAELTKLTPQEEADFRQWFTERAANTRTNPNPDDPKHFYDARGFWKDMKGKGTDPTVTGHLTDTYKLPGHPTFSIESKYYKPGMKAGRWEGEKYIPIEAGETPAPVEEVPVEAGFNPYQARKEFGLAERRVQRLEEAKQKAETLKTGVPSLWATPETPAERAISRVGNAILPLSGVMSGEQELLSPETMMEVPSVIATGALAGTAGRAIWGKLRPWLQSLVNKERGIVTQSIDDMLKRGYSEAEVLRRWDNPTWRKEALESRTKPEMSTEDFAKWHEDILKQPPPSEPGDVSGKAGRPPKPPVQPSSPEPIGSTIPPSSTPPKVEPPKPVVPPPGLAPTEPIELTQVVEEPPIPLTQIYGMEPGRPLRGEYPGVPLQPLPFGMVRPQEMMAQVQPAQAPVVEEVPVDQPIIEEEQPAIGLQPEGIPQGVAPRRLIRIEQGGREGAPSVVKPQGLYLSYEDLGTPHKDLGGKQYAYEATANNPLDVSGELEVKHVERYGLQPGDPVSASAGIKALAKLVPKEEFDRFLTLRKAEAQKEFAEKYPEVDWSRYYDSYEMLEAVAGIEARKAGHDAIISEEKNMPEFSEYVALSSSAIKDVPVEGTAVEGTEIVGEVENVPRETLEPSPSVTEPWRMTVEEWMLRKGGTEIFQRAAMSRKHMKTVKDALLSGDLTPEDYTRLHSKDYGPIEEFAPEVAVKEKGAEVQAKFDEAVEKTRQVIEERKKRGEFDRWKKVDEMMEGKGEEVKPELLTSPPESPMVEGVKGKEGKEKPTVEPQGPEGGKSRVALILKDGTVLVGGKIHPETYNLALQSGISEKELNSSYSAFLRPDGTAFNLQGKEYDVSRVVDLEAKEGKGIPAAETPEKPEGGKIDFEEFQKHPLIRTVGDDFSDTFLHGTSSKNLKTLADATRPESSQKPEIKTGKLGDLLPKELNEFGAELLLSEPRQPHQAHMWSQGKGSALAVIKVKNGTKVLDLSDEAARTPFITVGTKLPEVLQFFRRPAITDDFINWYKTKVVDGYKKAFPDWESRIEKSFDPDSPEFEVRMWRENLVRYAREKGYGLVRLADETLVTDRAVLEGVRKATPKELEGASKTRTYPPSGMASLFTGKPTGAYKEAHDYLNRVKAPPEPTGKEGKGKPTDKIPEKPEGRESDFVDAETIRKELLSDVSRKYVLGEITPEELQKQREILSSVPMPRVKKSSLSYRLPGGSIKVRPPEDISSAQIPQNAKYSFRSARPGVEKLLNDFSDYDPAVVLHGGIANRGYSSHDVDIQVFFRKPTPTQIADKANDVLMDIPGTGDDSFVWYKSPKGIWKSIYHQADRNIDIADARNADFSTIKDRVAELKGYPVYEAPPPAGDTSTAQPPKPEGGEIPKSLLDHNLWQGDGVTIYHGSKGKWANNKFDFSMVGKGHATTEGWGSYWATEKNHAKKFGPNIIEKKIPNEKLGMLLDLQANFSEQTQYVKNALKKIMETVETPSDSDIVSRATSLVKDRLYSMNPDPIFKRVAELKNKPKELVQYLKTFGEKDFPGKAYARWILGDKDMSGGEIYSLIEKEWGNSSKNASLYLNDYGIPGMISSADLLASTKKPTTQNPNIIIWNEDVFLPNLTPPAGEAGEVVPKESAPPEGGGEKPESLTPQVETPFSVLSIGSTLNFRGATYKKISDMDAEVISGQHQAGVINPKTGIEENVGVPLEVGEKVRLWGKKVFPLSEPATELQAEPTKPTEPPFYHVTFPENIESIGKEGLRASTEGELGPGVYLTQEPEKVTGPKYQGKKTVQVPVGIGNAKLLDLPGTGANLPLEIFETLFGREEGQKFYREHNKEIFGEGGRNWDFIQGTIKENGYDGIRLLDSASAKNTVIFDPGRLRVEPPKPEGEKPALPPTVKKSISPEDLASAREEFKKRGWSIVRDRYRMMRAPKEVKGIDARGEEIIGYAYSPDYFILSDATGRPIRHFIELKNGAIVHPDELNRVKVDKSGNVSLQGRERIRVTAPGFKTSTVGKFQNAVPMYKGHSDTLFTLKSLDSGIEATLPQKDWWDLWSGNRDATLGEIIDRLSVERPELVKGIPGAPTEPKQRLIKKPELPPSSSVLPPGIVPLPPVPISDKMAPRLTEEALRREEEEHPKYLKNLTDDELNRLLSEIEEDVQGYEEDLHDQRLSGEEIRRKVEEYRQALRVERLGVDREAEKVPPKEPQKRVEPARPAPESRKFEPIQPMVPPGLGVRPEEPVGKVVKRPAWVKEQATAKPKPKDQMLPGMKQGAIFGTKETGEPTIEGTELDRAAIEAERGKVQTSMFGKPEAKRFKPSGLSPESTLFNTPTDRFEGYAWRSMSPKEYDSLMAGEKVYGGEEAGKGQYLAPTPESASQYKGNGKILVEFGGVKKAEGETIGNVVGRDQVTNVWKFQDGKWGKLSAKEIPKALTKSREGIGGTHVPNVVSWIISKGGVRRNDPNIDPVGWEAKEGAQKGLLNNKAPFTLDDLAQQWVEEGYAPVMTTDEFSEMVSGRVQARGRANVITENFIQRAENEWNAHLEAIAKSDPDFLSDDSTNLLTSNIDDEIMGMKEEWRGQGLSEAEIGRKTAEVVETLKAQGVSVEGETGARFEEPAEVEPTEELPEGIHQKQELEPPPASEGKSFQPPTPPKLLHEGIGKEAFEKVPEEEKRRAWDQYIKDIDVYEDVFKKWASSISENEPVAFQTDNMVYLVTKDPEGGWRSSSFSRIDHMPWGHERYKTKFEALKEHRHDERIKDIPFEVEPLLPRDEFGNLKQAEPPVSEGKGGEPESTKIPERTADTMSEAIALSSPSGKMSERARSEANKRLKKELFGEKGLPGPKVEQPTEAESLLRRAKELRDLADRGMKPTAYRKEADRLEAKAKELEVKEDTGALYSMAPEPIWYSTLTRAIEKKMPNAADSRQIQGILSGAGVKADEIKWTGLDDFLEKNKDRKITKQEVLNHLKANQVEVREVVKGSVDIPIRDAIEQTSDKTWVLAGDAYTHQIMFQNYKYRVIRFNPISEAKTYGDIHKDFGGFNTLEEAKDAIVKDVTGLDPTGITATKFSQWQLPGGQNYRELLLTLPEVETAEYREAKNRLEDYWSRMETKYGKKSRSSLALEVTAAETEERHKLGAAVPLLPDPYRSSHFPDDPNILAHVRFNERTDSEGKRVLFLEELQSDWHQIGREKGYRTGLKQQNFKSWLEERGKTLTPEMETQFKTRKGAEIEAWRADQDKAIAENSSVPAAPFSKTWHELAMKRMVRWAAENGFDKIAWTTGEQQFQRWGSEEVAWVRNGDTWRVSASEQIGGGEGAGIDIENEARIRGLLRENKGVEVNDKEELRRVISQTLSRAYDQKRIDKLTDRVWDRMQKEDVGTSLPRKEGMERFYDTNPEKLGLVDYMNKFGKKWGVQVGDNQIVTADKMDKIYRAIIKNKDGSILQLMESSKETLNNMIPEVLRNSPGSYVEPFELISNELVPAETITVHSLPITAAMKDSVLQEGLPMFRRGETAKAPLPHFAIQSGVTSFLKGKPNAPIIHIVSRMEIPEHLTTGLEPDKINRIEGVYDRTGKANTIYLVEEKITSRETLDRLLTHEAVTHYAVEAMLGPKANQFYGEIWKKYGREGLKEIADDYGFDLGTWNGRYRAAREKVSKMTETGEDPGFLKRFYAWIREQVRRALPNLKITDLEIRNTIAKAKRWMSEGKGKEGPKQRPRPKIQPPRPATYGIPGFVPFAIPAAMALKREKRLNPM